MCIGLIPNFVLTFCPQDCSFVLFRLISKALPSSLAICILYSSDALAQSLEQYLRDSSLAEKLNYYTLTQFTSEEQFLNFIKQNDVHVDCLILQDSPRLQILLDQLRQQAIFFPSVVLNSSQLQPSVADSTKAEFSASHFLYHPATLEISITQLSQIVSAIDQAINKFLQLSSVTQSIPSTASNESPETHETQQSLKERQLRLSERLKERLGYLGVYYKRNPQNFIRYMSAYQREELLQQLKADYREIILAYFSDTADLNQKLDNFVNTAFFVDISVAQIVEIHMELMDEFSKQLKLEGRSDEILLDYRLTLIDTIAHLCEMYRRSIPRET